MSRGCAELDVPPERSALFPSPMFLSELAIYMTSDLVVELLALPVGEATSSALGN